MTEIRLFIKLTKITFRINILGPLHHNLQNLLFQFMIIHYNIYYERHGLLIITLHFRIDNRVEKIIRQFDSF